MGELGLAGELRRVRDLPQRLAEAARLGFQVAVVPAGRPRRVRPRERPEGRGDAGDRGAPTSLRAAAARWSASERARGSSGLHLARLTTARQSGPQTAAVASNGRLAWRSPVRSEEQLRLRATLASIAPGTALRDGLERILRGRTGALIVLGHDKTVESISTGGFTLDVPFTATGLRELAKMDGAIISTATSPGSSAPPST